MPMHHSREKQYIIVEKYEEYAAKAISTVRCKPMQSQRLARFCCSCFSFTLAILSFLT